MAVHRQNSGGIVSVLHQNEGGIVSVLHQNEGGIVSVLHQNEGGIRKSKTPISRGSREISRVSQYLPSFGGVRPFYSSSGSAWDENAKKMCFPQILGEIVTEDRLVVCSVPCPVPHQWTVSSGSSLSSAALCASQTDNITLITEK